MCSTDNIGIYIPLCPAPVPSTKLIVVLTFSRIIDAVGFLNPFVMWVKLMLHTLWRMNLDWYDQLFLSNNAE